MAYFKPKQDDLDSMRQRLEEMVDEAPHLGRGHLVPQEDGTAWIIPDELAEKLGLDTEDEDSGDEVTLMRPDDGSEDDSEDQKPKAPKRPGRPPAPRKTDSEE